MKNEKILISLMVRSLELENIIKNMPQQRFYESNSDYFKKLELRNEYLNKAVKLLNKEIALELPLLRVHQKDARYIYMEYKNLLTNRKAKKIA